MVIKTLVQCNDAAGFLHARQKAASHGNLASQDVETSNLQGDGHLVDDDAAPQPQQERRHLLPQSMSAVLSKLLTQHTAILLGLFLSTIVCLSNYHSPAQISTVSWACQFPTPSPPPSCPWLLFPDIPVGCCSCCLPSATRFYCDLISCSSEVCWLSTSWLLHALLAIQAC